MPIENVNAMAEYDPDSRYSEDVPEEDPTHPLDSEENKQTHKKLIEWRAQARQAHADNRMEQAIDEDYYDGDQWSPEDKEVIEARGQAALVFNEIKPAIDWIIGTEKRTRIDWKVVPREEDDREPAVVKSKLLKYVSDVNRTPFHRSRAFADAAISGVGWMEDSIRGRPGEEPLYSGYVSWREIWYDPMARDLDLADARYILREKWVDLDVAEAMFTERVQELRESAIAADHFGNDMDDDFQDSALYYRTDAQGRNVGRRSISDNTTLVNSRRSRVRLIEMWYRTPERVKVMRVDTFNVRDPAIAKLHGDKFNEANPVHAEVVANGMATVVESMKMAMRMAIMTEKCLMQDAASPYRHDSFPFTPVWGFKRRRDNAAYGVIRNQRDPQDDLNKRRSKALYILSTNKVLMEKGAVDDIDDLRDEAANPAGIIEYKKGYKLEMNVDTALANEHLMLEQRDGEYIRHVSGVTGENLGQETNATSGKAINARQMQGSVITASLFDNYRLAVQIQGEKHLSMIEQFYDEPKTLRIVGDRGRLDFRKINQPVVDPATGEVVDIENDIQRTKADFVVDEQDYRESIRMAMFETMTDLLSKLGTINPQVALNMLDLVVDFSDVPGKDEIVRRIRKINGQADPNDTSPEAQQAQEQQKKSEAEQAQLTMQQQLATIADAMGKAKKSAADADKSRIETLEKALLLVQQLSATPQLAPAADSLIAHERAAADQALQPQQ